MITNSTLTIYHKGFDATTRLETWTRFNYDDVWFFGGQGASTNKGYENANDVQVRIPYEKNAGLNASNFEIGDLIVQGKLNLDITSQQDLDGYLVYSIRSITDNQFGSQPHLHISGK